MIYKGILPINQGLIYTHTVSGIILETAVGQSEGCAHEGAEQGATTRNSDSIPRSCNAAMRPQGRAIRPVA